MRQEVYKNMTDALEFELKLQKSLDITLDNEDTKIESNIEPKIYHWNVTYADAYTVRAKLLFNNSLYISQKVDKVSLA